MTDPPKGVFLSYTSQDAGPAARICEALRAAGIEVWFDQSELRGGDAWDAAIRKQIKACALFIPVISASAHARIEGYFRLEWKLAVDRSHLIAATEPFLLPVVIDDTPQSDERIPDRFRELQWSHLPDGETPPAFVQRVARLLSSGPDRAVVAPGATAAAPAAPHPAPHASRRTQAALLVIAALAVIGAGYLALDKFVLSKPAAGAAPAAPAPSGAPAPSAVPEKSIAVLPFVDMSEKKDQEYFSDGLTEELLDLLAQVPDLRVSARTSSFYFKGRNEDVAVIAQKLRVAHVLEGSVRKAGSTVRVTAQLIRADNGYHLWSKAYDRDVKDIFKVQDEIAAAVVAELKTQLLPATPAAGERPVVNPDAHNQYLLGRELVVRDNGRDARRAMSAFQQATKLDPAYAGAWAGLADASFWAADDAESAAVRDAELQQATSAADKAIELQPTLAYGYLMRGLIRANTQWDFAAAEKDFQRAMQLEPDSVDTAMDYAGGVLIPTGRLAQAEALQRKALEADPLNARAWTWLGFNLLFQGNLAGAREALNRSLEISPDQVYAPAILASSFVLDGQPAKALEISQRATSGVFRLYGSALAQWDLGHRDASDQALNQLIAGYGFAAAAQIAEVYAYRGDKDHAFQWFERAYAQRDPGLTYIKVSSLLKNLKGDPRYAAWLRKLNLSQ
jgi:TolB-like protein/tetratricopeptide (TPR) repeat protein